MKSSAAAGWTAVKDKICQQPFSRSGLSQCPRILENRCKILFPQKWTKAYLLTAHSVVCLMFLVKQPIYFQTSQDPLLIISSNTKLFFDKYENNHLCLLLYRVIYPVQGQVSLSPLQTITDPWLTINPIKCHLFCLHWTATTAISNSIVDKTL